MHQYQSSIDLEQSISITFLNSKIAHTYLSLMKFSFRRAALRLLPNAQIISLRVSYEFWDIEDVIEGVIVLVSSNRS